MFLDADVPPRLFLLLGDNGFRGYVSFKSTFLGVPKPLFGEPLTGVINEFFRFLPGLFAGDFPVWVGISNLKDLSIIVKTSP